MLHFGVFHGSTPSTTNLWGITVIFVRSLSSLSFCAAFPWWSLTSDIVRTPVMLVFSFQLNERIFFDKEFTLILKDMPRLIFLLSFLFLGCCKWSTMVNNRVPSVLSKTYSTPRRPYEKPRLDAELKVIGEYGLRNKREVWRVKFALAKIRKAARTLLTLEEKDPKRLFEGIANFFSS